MKLNLEWKIAVRSLFRNWKRSLSSGVALTVAFVGISVFSGHVFKTSRALKSVLVYLHYLGHIAIYKPNGSEKYFSNPGKFMISNAELGDFRNIIAEFQPNIEIIGEFISASGLLSTGDRSIPVLVDGIDPKVDNYVRSFPLVTKWAPELLRDYSAKTIGDAIFENPESLSVSKGVAELIGIKGSIEELTDSKKDVSLAGQSVDGDLSAVNARLALFHTTGMPYVEDFSIRTSTELVQKLLKTEGVSHLSIYLKNEGDSKKIAKALNQRFGDSNLNLEAIPFSDDRIGTYYNGAMGFLFLMGIFFAILIMGASCLVIVNTMTINVIERSKEIGTMLSLGFSKAKIRNLFLKEVFVLTVASLIMAVGVLFVLTAFIDSMGWHFQSPGMAVPIEIKMVILPAFEFGLAVFLVLVAMISTHLVIKRKCRQQIVILLTE